MKLFVKFLRNYYIDITQAVDGRSIRLEAMGIGGKATINVTPIPVPLLIPEHVKMFVLNSLKKKVKFQINW